MKNTIQSIMSTNLITVREETPIYEAMHLLQKHRISGMPVVDDENHVVGILTEKDVLEVLMDTKIGGKDAVKHYMTRKVISFTEADSPIDICEFFIKNSIRRVPIVKDGKLIGVVSRRDIISFILDINSKVSDYRFS